MKSSLCLYKQRDFSHCRRERRSQTDRKHSGVYRRDQLAKCCGCCRPVWWLSFILMNLIMLQTLISLDCYKHFYSSLQDIYRLYQAWWKRHRLVQYFICIWHIWHIYLHLHIYIYTYMYMTYIFTLTQPFINLKSLRFLNVFEWKSIWSIIQ